jgi:hypothetical protein
MHTSENVLTILTLERCLPHIIPLLCEKVKAVTSQPSGYHGYARGLFLSDITAIDSHTKWLIYDLHIYCSYVNNKSLQSSVSETFSCYISNDYIITETVMVTDAGGKYTVFDNNILTMSAI